MKEKICLVAILLMVLAFTGCSRAEETLSEVMLDKSGILQDEEYIEYQSYQEAEMLDDEGYYKTDIMVEVNADLEENDTLGMVHVSYAENSYLVVSYYSDAECTKKLDQSDCYLKPGDCIYAIFDEELHPESNKYRLQEFRIREYDSTGTFSNSINVSYIEKGLVYQIPQNYTGNQIVVLPIGEYPDVQVSVNVYAMDAKGTPTVLEDAGVWWANDEKCESNTFTVSPVEPYTVKLDFDEENYFYVSSEPECFTPTPQLVGEVEFYEIEPVEDNVEYSVELHKYLTLTIESEDSFTYKENDGDIKEADDGLFGLGNGEKTFKKLKYGDRITIETEGEIQITGDYQNVHFTHEKMSEGNRYVITMVRYEEGNFATSKKFFGLK